MTEIIHFKSKAEQTTKQNLFEFIALARDKIELWESHSEFSWEHSSFPTRPTKELFLSV